MTFDKKQFQTLMTEKKYEQARIMIKAAMAEKITPEERGGALVDFATLYMDVMNRIRGEYKGALEDAVASLQKLNSAKSTVKDILDLDSVRAKLDNQ
jgi:hypothetical protein